MAHTGGYAAINSKKLRTSSDVRPCDNRREGSAPLLPLGLSSLKQRTKRNVDAFLRSLRVAIM